MIILTLTIKVIYSSNQKNKCWTEGLKKPWRTLLISMKQVPMKPCVESILTVLWNVMNSIIFFIYWTINNNFFLLYSNKAAEVYANETFLSSRISLWTQKIEPILMVNMLNLLNKWFIKLFLNFQETGIFARIRYMCIFR